MERPNEVVVPSNVTEQGPDLAKSDASAGIFKLFLGYAPGVGKTYNMLSEAIRRKSRGEDVVIGIVETHGRPGVQDLAGKLEAVPPAKLEYYGTVFEEMDLQAVLKRKPQVVLVDELAHTNVEGSKHRKRYEDVLALLEAHINVLSTMNIQHLESLRPSVQNLTGITVREVVPDWIIRRADEVVLADLTPEALQTRLRRGDIYPKNRAEQALSNFFRRGNLIALREMALQQVTRAVDRTLDEYVRRKHLGSQWALQEKIAVCISSSPSCQELIVRGIRMAERIEARLYVIHVVSNTPPTPDSQRSLQANLRFAENLGAEIVQLTGKSVARTLAEFVRERRITHVIFGRSNVRGIRQYLYMLAMQHFLNSAPYVDVHIITQDKE
jgi:two-component system, OmpR family, sensor histidine kinase KdpD